MYSYPSLFFFFFTSVILLQKDVKFVLFTLCNLIFICLVCFLFLARIDQLLAVSQIMQAWICAASVTALYMMIMAMISEVNTITVIHFGEMLICKRESAKVGMLIVCKHYGLTNVMFFPPLFTKVLFQRKQMDY